MDLLETLERIRDLAETGDPEALKEIIQLTTQAIEEEEAERNFRFMVELYRYEQK